MKAVILAGGLGTRISEETSIRPKPMVEIGGRPILWHIMKIYAHHGIDEFVVCLGYRGEVIKDFFINYHARTSDVTCDLGSNTTTFHTSRAEPWKVTLVDTGADTMTGGRIKRIAPYVANDEAFCLTYGDGVSDIDITASIDLHRKEGRLATVTAVQPPGRFGALRTDGDHVTGFREKPADGDGLINGGFFVLSPQAIDTIKGDDTVWENSPLEALVDRDELSVYRHEGFWQPMDTLRDKNYLEGLWSSNKAPWRVWE
ncbi:MAG: glucose-1-phosphate cytidylyltransferase [Pseudoxanthomonas sp.]